MSSAAPIRTGSAPRLRSIAVAAVVAPAHPVAMREEHSVALAMSWEVHLVSKARLLALQPCLPRQMQAHPPQQGYAISHERHWCVVRGYSCIDVCVACEVARVSCAYQSS